MPSPSGTTESNPGPFADAELYDIFCGGIDYDLEYYTSLARRSGGPALDVACGTGRVTIPMLQAGVEVDGVDLHQPMLDRLRAKASALGYAPILHKADMASFQTGRRYRLVTICFNAFIHNVTADDQIGCLRCCRESLEEGGLLAFDTFFPGRYVIGTPPGTRVMEGEIEDPRTGETLRVWDTRTFDLVAQTQLSVMEVESVNAAGEVRTIHRSEFLTRFVYRAEMELLLHLAGFERWEIAGNFEGKPLTDETDSMIVKAWR
jgi:SAM-dependent methyltransferase